MPVKCQNQFHQHDPIHRVSGICSERYQNRVDARQRRIGLFPSKISAALAKFCAASIIESAVN
jgi:hypothetical protein